MQYTSSTELMRLMTLQTITQSVEGTCQFIETGQATSM